MELLGGGMKVETTIEFLGGEFLTDGEFLTGVFFLAGDFFGVFFGVFFLSVSGLFGVFFGFLAALFN